MPNLDLTQYLTQYFPFLNRNKNALPRGEMLALRPLRSAAVAWTPKPGGEDGAAAGVQITVPRRDDKLARILGRVFQMPPTKTIELDEFGAAVWEKCDGRHSVEQLVNFTAGAYKLNRRQAEVSVVSFMRMLAQRRLIGLEERNNHVTRSERPRPAPKRGRRRH